MLDSHTQTASLQLNGVALEETSDFYSSTLFSQLHVFLTVLHSCASLVSIFKRYHAACIASVAACSSASVWASSLQHCSGLLRSWGGITNSAIRMTAAANAASTSSTLLSLGGFNCCGYILSKMRISLQAPTVHWSLR